MKVAYKKDIDRNLSEKLKMDFNLVEKHTEFLIKRWKQMLYDENIVTIKVPHLGSMYVNIPMAARSLKIKSRKNLIKEKIKNTFSLIKEEDFGRSKRWMIKKEYPRISNRKYTLGKMPNDLEIIQNEAREESY